VVAIQVRSSAAADLVIGMQWIIDVQASELPTLVVTKPDGTTLIPAVIFTQYIAWTGPLPVAPFAEYVYRAVVAPSTAGRWVATASTVTDGTAWTQAFVSAVSVAAGFPTPAELSDWLGGTGAHSYTTQEMTEELAAATVAQRRHCNIPVAYPVDLREALLRRAARLLFMRRQLTEQPRESGDFALPSTVPLGRDWSTRELEQPFLKTPVG